MSTPAPHSMGTLDWSALLFLGLLYGSSFLFMHIAVQEVPPATLVFIRVASAGLALSAAMAWQGLSFRPFIENWRLFLAVGLLTCTFSFLLATTAQKHIGPGMGAILYATMPIFSVFLGQFLTSDEKITSQKLIGVLAGFAGVVILIGPGALWHPNNETWAELLGLGSAASAALGNFQGRKLKQYPALTMTTASMLITAVATLPVAVIYDGSLALPTPSPMGLFAIAWLVLPSTILSSFLYYWMLQRVGATNLTLVSFITPISAVILGIVFKSEQFGLGDLAGMLIIGLSLLIIGGRLRLPRAFSVEKNI